MHGDLCLFLFLLKNQMVSTFLKQCVKKERKKEKERKKTLLPESIGEGLPGQICLVISASVRT